MATFIILTKHKGNPPPSIRKTMIDETVLVNPETISAVFSGIGESSATIILASGEHIRVEETVDQVSERIELTIPEDY